jgi:hypothetical protein
MKGNVIHIKLIAARQENFFWIDAIEEVLEALRSDPPILSEDFIKFIQSKKATQWSNLAI